MEFFCSIFTRCRERRAYSPEVGTHGASLDADWQDFDEINNFDEAFISSSGIGILACYWNGWKSDYKITKKIKKILADKLTNW